MNGSCTHVCPVKINIHEQLYQWRRVLAEHHELPFVKREMMRMAGKLLGQPKLYRAALRGAETALSVVPRFLLYNAMNPWGKNRELPHPVSQTFHAWYQENRVKKGQTLS